MSAWRALVLVSVVLCAWTGVATGGWETFTPRDGLANNTTNAIFEDHTGAMWFATSGGGVSRYDGINWRTFTSADGLADPVVWSIAEDPAGALWFATSGGVSRYDGVSWKRFTFADGLADYQVHAVLADRTGVLWFATNSGVSRYDGATWRTFTTADGLAGNIVEAIAEDHTGALWFGTTSGASRYDGVSWKTFTTANGLMHNIVNAIVEDRNGVLWFATSGGGVSNYDGSRWGGFRAGYGLANDMVWSIVEDQNGALWFGTLSSGVSRYDGSTWRTYTTADGLAGDNIWALFRDHNGGLWFGTGDGVSRYDGVSWAPFSTTGGIPSNMTTAMYEDHAGGIWFGSLDSGVSRYDSAGSKTFTTANGLANNRVNAIFEDRDRAMWFATPAGVSRYDGAAWRTYATADGLGGNWVSAILQDRGGALWLATSGGASRFDGTAWKTFKAADGLVDSRVRAILEDRSGMLWFGTAGRGVSRYDGASWTTYAPADGPSTSAVSAIVEARTGALWFGTDAGIRRYDGQGWRTYTRADGLANDQVNAIVEDRARGLWFGTQGGGVSHYDGVSWRTFTNLDGMTGYNFVAAIMEDRKGALLFAAPSVTRLEPDRVSPHTVITSKPRLVSANAIPVVAFGVGFRESARVLFSFSLNGEPWTSWSQDAYWSPGVLPDGRYVLEVRARDDMGNTDPTSATAVFEIDATPPSPFVRFPGPDAAVRDSVVIRGTAADARFGYYRLEYRIRGAATWTTLVDTTRVEVTDGMLGGWNTCGLADGKYEIRLSVADTLGLTGTAIVPLSVDNQFPYFAQTSPALVMAAAGGDVYTDDASAHLYLPPHGLSQDTTVTVAVLDTIAIPPSLPDGATRVNAGYELSWGTVTLAKTATLDVAVPGSAAGAAVYSAGPDSAWRRIGGTLDVGTGRITVPVSGPGRYALYREGSVPATPGEPRLSAVTLTPRVFSPRGTYANREVAIAFTLGRPGTVTVEVYNRAGRLVRDVATNLSLGAGANVVRWDGRGEDGREVQDGIYLIAIGAFGETHTQTVAVVR
jgi:ligand-binding sensor domain-containing protein